MVTVSVGHILIFTRPHGHKLNYLLPPFVMSMAATTPPSPTSSQWNPHPTLYRKPFYVVFAVRESHFFFGAETDRNINLKVEDTTFGLDVGGLLQHSVLLGEILQVESTIPRSEGTESNPIVVHGVTVQHFESFMTWLHHL